MGDSLKWSHSDYEEEYETYLKEKEKAIPLYCYRSPQLSGRQETVKFIKLACEHLECLTVTCHLAVHLLDQLMDNYDMKNENTLKPVAVCCVLVSAKALETQPTKISSLHLWASEEYSTEDINCLELFILKHFKCNLIAPTAAQFMESYKLYSCSKDDSSENDLKQLQTKVYSTLNKYLDLFLEDNDLIRFSPSLVAASCIYSTRCELQLTPNWTNVLKDKTGYSEEDVKECFLTYHKYRTIQIFF